MLARSERSTELLRRDGCYQALLFGILLFPARSIQLVRRGPASSILASLKRFGEAELGIGITVNRPAAHLRRFLPPRISFTTASVAQKSLPVCLHARQDSAARLFKSFPRTLMPRRKSLRSRFVSTESYVPARLVHARHCRGKSWSEYNIMGGILVLSDRAAGARGAGRKSSWARNWPLPLRSLGISLLRSDPETWPLGPVGFWATLADPEVLLHRFFAVLVIVLAVFEWRVQTGRVASGRARLAFPVLIAVSGACFSLIA